MVNIVGESQVFSRDQGYLKPVSSGENPPSTKGESSKYVFIKKKNQYYKYNKHEYALQIFDYIAKKKYAKRNIKYNIKK